MENQEVALYVDDQIKEIKEGISSLKEDIIDLMETKLTIERKIYRFNDQYNEKVGPSLLRYLKQREKNIKELIEDTDNENKKDGLKEKLKEAKEDTEDFGTYSDEKPNVYSLSSEEEATLKALYKKACRLCHPDIVDETFKDEALSFFHRLNEANQKKDIAKVKEILEYLQGNSFTLSDIDSDMEILKKRHSTLKSDTIKLEIEIQDLKSNETYKKIMGIKNWDKYFHIISSQLNKEVYKQKMEEAKNNNPY